MSNWLVGVVAPIALWLIALALGRRELTRYRQHDEIGSDLFVYTRGRLIRRMTGVVVLALTGLTLAAMEIVGPKTPRAQTIYLAALTTEVLAMVVLPIVDLVETGRSADPADLTRQAGPDRRTRTRPRPPR